MIGNIERWRLCYDADDDDPNSNRDSNVPTNLTRDEEESKRQVEYIDNWLREPSTNTNTFSHIDPFAQAQAELPSYRETMEWLSSEPAANYDTAEMLPECVI